MHTLIIGAGYSGSYVAQCASQHGSVHATRRTPEGVLELSDQGVHASVLDGQITESLSDELLRTTHLVICVAPNRTQPFHDPIHSLFRELQKSNLPRLKWVGYLSTIGVYGNHDGRWIDEKCPCLSRQARSMMRIEAENAWRSFSQTHSVPLGILRLSGIYGPGRNAIEDAMNGKGRILIKQHQVFNRIHVEDLAKATVAAGLQQFDGILNITDDVPAPPQEVVRFAHAMCQRTAPNPRDFETADISPMARSFYSENKRVLNTASKRILNFQYSYPNYRTGLACLWKQYNEGL